MTAKNATRVTWVFDRDAASNPFIEIAIDTLRGEGYEVFLIDGAENKSNSLNSIHPYSRAHWDKNLGALKDFINANKFIRWFDRRNEVLAGEKAVRASQKSNSGQQDLANTLALQLSVALDKARSAIYNVLWRGIRRLGLIRRDTVDTWSPYFKGFLAILTNPGDIIVVGRATTLLPALVVARLFRRRIIYYPFELYGEQAARYSRVVAWSERFALRIGVDGLVTQNHRRADVYRERGHRGACAIVHNYKVLSRAKSGGGLRSRLNIPADKRIVLYEGVLIPGRWLDRVAEASMKLPDDTVMVFLGPTRRWWNENHSTFTSAPIKAGKLIIAPPAPHGELLDLIADADVGIIIYDDSTRNNYYCEPGKLSDYVFAGIPVVAPDFPTVGPIVRSLGIGSCFSSFTPQGIAASIEAVLNRPKEEWRQPLDAASAVLNWSTQAPTLIAAISERKQMTHDTMDLTLHNQNSLNDPMSANSPVLRPSKKQVDILILIEHADRELDVACLTRALISEQAPQLKVKIANFYTEAQTLISTIEPRVVVTPFLYAIEDKIMRDYVAAWSQSSFFNMAWEQILYGSQQTLKRPRDEFTRDRVRHLAWSEWFSRYLQSHGVLEEKIHWIGNPLYDLYDPKFREYFPNRNEIARRFGLDPDKRWIFFPENFRWAFLSDKKFRAMSEQGVEMADLESQRDYCRVSLAACARWLASAAAGGGIEAILRPRPAVNTQQIREFVEKEIGETPANFHILKQLSVREWIFASDLTVSSISTSLIEAAVARKPILRASPVEVPGTLWYEWCAHVPVAESEDAFLVAVRGELDMTGSDAVLKWAGDNFKVGAAPTRALATLLIRLANETPQPNKHRLSPLPPDSPIWLNNILPFVPASTRHAMRSRYQSGYFFNAESHEKDLFGDFEVDRRTRKWRFVLDRIRRSVAA